jgi:DNA polymerase elongation subunit (family B)
LTVPGSVEFDITDSKRQNFKDLSNSVWGTVSYPKSRIYHILLAKAITKMGRFGILWIRKRAEKKGYTVATGDTDSVLIEFLVYNIKIMQEFASEITKSLPFLFKKLTGLEIKGVNLALERVSSKVIFVKKTDGSSIAKKKRSERVVWEKGKECDYLKIIGFEYRRRDQSRAIKDMQWEVLNMILYNRENEVFNHLLGIVKKFDPKTADINEIKMSKGIGKFLDKYGGIGKHGRKNPIPPHVVAAMYSNEHLNKNYDIGSQLNYVFIKRMPHPYPQTDILAFDELDDIPKGTIIDFEEHLSKMKNKIERIIETLGLTWTNVVTGTLGMSEYALKYRKR